MIDPVAQIYVLHLFFSPRYDPTPLELKGFEA
jgi:hypothetical protein